LRYTKTCRKVAVTSRLRTAISEYMRVSCAYTVRNGLTAASAAQISPARRPKSDHPAQRPPGTASSEIATERLCVSPGPLPTIFIQPWSSM
jgi:hypothetical protein